MNCNASSEARMGRLWFANRKHASAGTASLSHASHRSNAASAFFCRSEDQPWTIHTEAQQRIAGTLIGALVATMFVFTVDNVHPEALGQSSRR